jgi:hypothetical protein
MGYNKIIIYGNNIETYEYEKDIIVLGGRRKHKLSADARDESLGADGKNTLSSGQLGKRQDNARRASLAFRRLVGANLGKPPSPLLATLTYGKNFTNLARAYRHYSSFVQALRHKFGKDFRYICVPEFQKRGAVHFHALVWGLPTEVFLLERKTRTLAGLWKQGFVYLKETDGNDKLSFYLSKYMAKAFVDARLKNQKCYVASRNVLRPQILGGSFPLWPILDDYGVDETPVIDKTYDTNYLKKCRYRLFKIKE